MYSSLHGKVIHIKGQQNEAPIEINIVFTLYDRFIKDTGNKNR